MWITFSLSAVDDLPFIEIILILFIKFWV